MEKEGPLLVRLLVATAQANLDLLPMHILSTFKIPWSFILVVQPAGHAYSVHAAATAGTLQICSPVIRVKIELIKH